MKILPFEREHMEELADYGGQPVVLDSGGLDELAGLGPGFTGFINGEVVGCCGIVMIHDHRAMAWGAIRSTFTRHFIKAHRAVHRFLWEECEVPRVEAIVDVEYEQGHRWVQALGFVQEGPALPYYLPGGRDGVLYARIRRQVNGIRTSDSSDSIDSIRRGGRDRGDPAGERCSSSG
jgi:RimJ/RimL family protein N-acetyltransferase